MMIRTPMHVITRARLPCATRSLVLEPVAPRQMSIVVAGVVQLRVSPSPSPFHWAELEEGRFEP